MKLKKDNVILRTENLEEIEALKQRGFKEIKEVKKPKEKEVFEDETIKEEVKKPKNKDY